MARMNGLFEIWEIALSYLYHLFSASVDEPIRENPSALTNSQRRVLRYVMSENPASPLRTGR